MTLRQVFVVTIKGFIGNRLQIAATSELFVSNKIVLNDVNLSLKFTNFVSLFLRHVPEYFEAKGTADFVSISALIFRRNLQLCLVYLDLVVCPSK